MRIAGPAVPFIDQVPAYEIRDGNMYILVGGECLCCMSLRVFRLGMVRAAKAMAKHDAAGKVVPIHRRGHAAS